MKIAIDIRAISNENRARGIGLYTRNLVEALAEIDHDNEYILVAQSSSLPIRLPDNNQTLTVPSFAHPLIDRILGRLMVLPKLGRMNWDVFLQPDLSYGLPKRHGQTIGVVYDFIELEYPMPAATGIKQMIGNGLRARLLAAKLAAMEQADALISISQFTARELHRRFPTLKQPVAAIPLGVKPHYTSSGHKPETAPTKPFFLYVGGADARKNLATLITAFEQIRQEHDIALVLVGSDFTNQNIKEQSQLRRQISTSPAKDDIHCLGFIPEEQVVWLYHQAMALTFPSLAEGFGLELIEAMAAGCPVICYNRAAMPEVAQGAALMVNDDAGFGAAMKQIIQDKAAGQRLAKLGRERAAAFTWEQTAKATLEFMMEINNEDSR